MEREFKDLPIRVILYILGEWYLHTIHINMQNRPFIQPLLDIFGCFKLDRTRTIFQVYRSIMCDTENLEEVFKIILPKEICEDFDVRLGVCEHLFPGIIPCKKTVWFGFNTVEYFTQPRLRFLNKFKYLKKIKSRISINEEFLTKKGFDQNIFTNQLEEIGFSYNLREHNKTNSELRGISTLIQSMKKLKVLDLRLIRTFRGKVVRSFRISNDTLTELTLGCKDFRPIFIDITFVNTPLLKTLIIHNCNLTIKQLKNIFLIKLNYVLIHLCISDECDEGKGWKLIPYLKISTIKKIHIHKPIFSTTKYFCSNDFYHEIFSKMKNYKNRVYITS